MFPQAMCFVQCQVLETSRLQLRAHNFCFCLCAHSAELGVSPPAVHVLVSVNILMMFLMWG